MVGHTGVARVALVAVALLLAIGAVSRWGEARWGKAWPSVRPPAGDVSGFTPAALLGAAGGVRQLTANVAWLRSALAWERQDAAEMVRQASRAVSAEPEEWLFWQNTARRLAFDLAFWDSTKDWTLWTTDTSDPTRREFFARVALRWLDRAERAQPENPAVDLERALIHLLVRQDRAASAQSYRDAWRKPGAPTYAARFYGEWLRETDQLQTAWNWYRELYDQLPSSEPPASRHIVENRLRSLARTLELSDDLLPTELRTEL